MLRSSAFCLLSLFGVSSSMLILAQSSPGDVSSPDHQIAAHFSVQTGKQAAGPDGQLVYSVTFHGKQVFEDSALRLELENQTSLGGSVHITTAATGSGVDDYNLLAGKTSAVHDSYNSLALEVRESTGSGRTFEIEARVYNSGLAFRYHVPEQTGLSRYQLTQEDTEFRPVMDADAWALRLPNYQSAYESEYVPQVLSALSNQGGVSSYILNGAPMLLHMPGLAWAAVGEAYLEGNSSMYLENPTGNWTGHYLVSKISPTLDGKGPAVDASLPHNSA
jgi:alpha-glucosidase